MKSFTNTLITIITFVSLIACGEGVIIDDHVTISEQTALTTATNWMKQHYPERESYEVKNIIVNSDNYAVTNYAIEFENGGFVLVSATSFKKPILGYSNKNSVTADDDTNHDNIDNIISQLRSTEEARDSNDLVNQTRTVRQRGATNVISPLIETKWSQSGGYHPNFTYNNYTPYVTSNDRAPAGCVAVAFGQVLNYWGFPNRGIGYNRYCSTGRSVYNCWDGEIVEAYFGNTEYDWNDMPDKLGYSSSNTQVDAVSELLYHVGVSVNAKYGEHGTSAQIDNPAVFNGFKRHFRMTEVRKVSRSDYSNSAWAALIHEELRNKRPVVFFGEDVNIGAGHAYIIDGIDANGFVHVNWGWGGAANGYFDMQTLIIDGRYSFTDGLAAYINFAPPMETKVETFLSQDVERWGHPSVIQYGPFETKADISIEMTGYGDADLYVKKGSAANKSNYDCRPYVDGSNETCNFNESGLYYVSVYGAANISTYDLTVTYKKFDQ